MWLVLGGLVSASLLGDETSHAQAPAFPHPLVKGRIQGGEALINPVWAEARDPKNHRYTFRTPSATVSKAARRITAYLPKELTIAVLKKDGAGTASGKPVLVTVSGGRTTPVTIVVPEGQNVQFVNADPFSHRLFDVGQIKNGLGPEETIRGGSRKWQPPGPGVYEIRDELSPSVRSWVVVEASVAAVTSPAPDGTFALRELPAGSYQLQGFFMGKAVGKALPIDVHPTPVEQELPNPLVVGEAKPGAPDEVK
ncbi:MAG: hypothetical protein EXR75_13925 [Myxococcales bacterium]|nr:hypothetical protein [Myxococcales bacterium]